MRGRLLPILFLSTVLAACLESPDSPPTDSIPPLVWLVEPLDSAVITSRDTIQIGASDDEGVVRVAAYVDGDSLAEDLDAPYEIPYDLGRSYSDTFLLHAAAWDAAGNLGLTDTLTLFTPAAPAPPDTLAPVVVITQPEDGAWIEGPITVMMNATDDDSVLWVNLTVDGIDVGQDETPPLSVSWDPSDFADDSWHTLVARGNDPSGNWGESDAVTVKVWAQEYEAPELLSPMPGDNLPPAGTLRFTWRRHPISSLFRFELAEDPEFATVAHAEELTDTSLVLTALEYGQYYWRLSSGRSGGPWSDWSQIHDFRFGLVFDGEFLAVNESSTGYAIKGTPEGGLILAGSIGDDLLLLKLDQLGGVDWHGRYFTDLDYAVGHELAARESGGWYVLGRGSLPSLGQHVLVMDVDDQGTDLQQRTYWAASPVPVGIESVGGGDVITLLNCSAEGSYFQVDCLDPVGNIPWHLQIGSDFYGSHREGGSDTASDLAYDDEHEEIVFLHHSYSWWDYGYYSSHEAILSARDRSTGGPRWQLTLGQVFNNDGEPYSPTPRFSALRLEPGGPYTCAGYQGEEAILVHVSADHDTSEITIIAGLEPFYINDIDRLSSGEIVMVGRRGYFNDYDAVIALCDDQGTVIWENSFGEPGNLDSFEMVHILPNDNIAVIGTTNGFGHPDGVLWLKQFDEAGSDITR